METDQNHRITFQDISDMTGLSRATVCRAVNGLANVSSSAKKKVEEAVARLGYRPDPTLSALSKYRWSRSEMASQKYSIALVSSASTNRERNPHYQEVAGFFDECASTHDVRFTHFFFEDFKSSTALGAHLYSTGFDGLVVRMAQPMLNWAFPWEKFAIVTIGYDHPDHLHHSIVPDFGGATRLCFAKAAEAGSCCPGVMLFQHEHPVMDSVLRGAALDCLENQPKGGRGVPPIFVYTQSDILNPAATKRFVSWFEKYRPDYIIDGNTLGVFWLREGLGLRAHADVGYASLMLANSNGTSHPGVDHQYGLLTSAAFEKVLNLLQLNRRGPSSNPLRSIVPCRWEDAKAIPAVTQSKRAAAKSRG